MDSLLASYASSDEEEEDQRINPTNQKQGIEDDGEVGNFAQPTWKSINFSLPPPKSSSFTPNPRPLKPQQLEKDSDDVDESPRVEPSSLFTSLPPPKPSSSLFTSLPPPKSSSSLFSSIPPPKADVPDPVRNPDPAPSVGNSKKRVVQVRLPANPPLRKYADDDDEDEDEEEKEKRMKKAESLGQTASVKSFLSSIPAPKNSGTLGALPSASGSGRRSIIETSNSSSTIRGTEVDGAGGNTDGYNEDIENVDVVSMSLSSSVSDSIGNAVGGGSTDSYSNWGDGNENYVNYDGYSGYGTVDRSSWNGASGDCTSYGYDTGNYSNYGHYENSWSDVSTPAVAPQIPADSELGLSAKRGRKDVPPQIVEVNQDELMKNRPRQDQAKLTGIAFGPAYQPASSVKGKPSKLHKRKHQINTLYFDMKQKEMELAERRSRGLLTKAQTQGKYGW